MRPEPAPLAGHQWVWSNTCNRWKLYENNQGFEDIYIGHQDSSSVQRLIHESTRPAPVARCHWTHNRASWILHRTKTDNVPSFLIGPMGSFAAAEWMKGKAHKSDTEPAAVAGYRWIYYPAGDVWQLCEMIDTLGGKTCFGIGNEDAPGVQSFIQKVRDMDAAEDARRAEPEEEEPVLVDPEMPALEEAPNVATYTYVTPTEQSRYPPGTVIQILEDMPGYKQGYEAGARDNAALTKMNDARKRREVINGLAAERKITENMLSEQTRETARLAANLEAQEKDLDATKAALSREQTMHKEAVDALQSARAEHRAARVNSNNDRVAAANWAFGMLLLALFVFVPGFFWLSHDRDVCRAEVHAIRALASRSTKVIDVFLQAADDMRGSLTPLLLALEKKGV